MTRSGGDFQPRPLKRLFTANQCWTSFLDAGGLRDIEVEAVTKMLACGTRILGVKDITTESQWRSLVLKAGGKYWHVYMSKKTAGGRNTARYLGRYLKKPPIAASRLAHYNGGASLSFRYLDHKTGETATETLTQRELVARLKQHIPEKFFKMVRYFGFLANRVCGEKLPQVYRALGMDKPEPVAKVCYAQMVKQFLSRDPFECVLCGGRMVYRRAIAGLNVSGLKKNARDISLLRYMPA
ncbi:transposase [Escherichia coli]